VSLLGFGPLLAVGCKDAPLEFALSSPEDLTCSEWLDINQVAAHLMCSEECTDTCKAIIDNVYAGCSATDTTTSDDGDDVSAQVSESAASILRNDDCNNYADTESFKADASYAKTDASTAQVISSSRIMEALLCLSFCSFLASF
jgi:hypothetical protein